MGMADTREHLRTMQIEERARCKTKTQVLSLLFVVRDPREAAGAKRGLACASMHSGGVER